MGPCGKQIPKPSDKASRRHFEQIRQKILGVFFMTIEKTGMNRPIQAANELAARKVARAQHEHAERPAQMQTARQSRKDSICLSGQAVPPTVSLQDIKGELMKSLTAEKPAADLARLRDSVKDGSYKPVAERLTAAMLGISEDEG